MVVQIPHSYWDRLTNFVPSAKVYQNLKLQIYAMFVKPNVPAYDEACRNYDGSVIRCPRRRATRPFQKWKVYLINIIYHCNYYSLGLYRVAPHFCAHGKWQCNYAPLLPPPKPCLGLGGDSPLQAHLPGVPSSFATYNASYYVYRCGAAFFGRRCHAPGKVWWWGGTPSPGRWCRPPPSRRDGEH